jgi:ABC-type branched-subunit amino acid transport system substrate-binding protein
MNRSHRIRLAAAAGIAAVAMVIAACSSSSGTTSSKPSGSGSSSALTSSAPGITPTSILIGSHQPLTGVAAPGYSEIAPAANAYFQYVNAHGGVNGRKITYKYLDDAYNPTQTVSVVHQLVLQNSVYAIFNGLGTPTHLNVVTFLNSQKVPDVFVASGCRCWDNPGTYPETFGWQINYVREGKILGSYIAQHFKGMKIGYFYQNDEFGQDGVKGLDYMIPKAQVVAREAYNVAATNPAQEAGTLVAKLKAAGAQVVVSFSVPAFTALLRLSELTLSYNPTLVVSDVGSDPITLEGLLNSFAKKTGGFGASLIQGMITDGYLPSLGSTSNSWITLFKKVHDSYLAKLPFDGNVLYGMAVGYTFVQAMLKAGRNPTRQDLVSALNAGNFPQGPSVAPYAYSGSSHDGITGAYIGVIRSGVLVPQGDVLTTDNTATGAVTPFMTAQPAAPASGVPSP